MRNILFYVLTVLGGYLLGCSSMAYYYVSRWEKVNLSTNGSGNWGPPTPPSCWVSGWTFAWRCVAFSRAVRPPCCWQVAAAGPDPRPSGCRVCRCVMAHMYPLPLKGGKGGGLRLPNMGMLLTLDWRLGLALIGVSLLVTFCRITSLWGP